MEYKFPSDYWRLCDDVTVVQAALLVLDIEPEGIQERVFDTITFQDPVKPEGFDTVLAALKNALITGKIKPTHMAKVKQRVPTEDDVGAMAWMEVESDDFDFQKTTISVTDLRHWLIGKGMKGKFFFPDGVEYQAAYLDPTHKYYAPKLAAAVKAWIVVSQDDTALRGRTPKQALDSWLRSHADEYGLLKDGSFNALAIEEISKVANWKPEGGAARTPSAENKEQEKKSAKTKTHRN